MADITRRRTGELVQGILRILKDQPDGMRARDVVSKLERLVPPTDFELSTYESRGARRYDKIVRFSTIAPVKAGWLVKSKGRWTITDAGISALDRFSDPEQFIRESIRLYREWKASRDDASTSEADDASTSAEAAAATVPPAYEEAEESAWEEIESYLAGMDPYDFQNLVAALLGAMEYHVDWVAPPGPDHGVDIIAYPDPLGANEPCIKVSVRRRSAKTDVKDIREFISVLHGSDLGIFVSLSGFTRAAQDLARSDPRKLRLFDIERIFDLWVEHYAQIDEASKRLLPLRPVHFLAVVSEDTTRQS